MSPITRCNYCTLRSIERAAGKKDYVVTVIDDNVYMHPRGVTIRWDSPREMKDRYFRCWLMELTAQCACYEEGAVL